MVKPLLACVCGCNSTRLVLDSTLQPLILLLQGLQAAIPSRPLLGRDYRTASRRGGVSTKRGGSWMGRPGRAGRGVRLGEGGGGRGLMHAPRKRACAMAFNTPTSCNPFPMGQRQCPLCSAVWGLGPREWGRRGGGGRAESDGTWGRTPLTCDGSVLGVGVGSTAGVDAAPPLDEAGGVNSPPVVLGGVDAPAPNSSERLRGCTAGVPGGGGGAAHVGDRRSCAWRGRNQRGRGRARARERARARLCGSRCSSARAPSGVQPLPG
jgi:hypothetical protein